MVPMAPSSTRMRSRATRRSFSSALVIGTDIVLAQACSLSPQGERGGVRGIELLLVERAQDGLKHALEILHHVVVPKPKHEISHRFQSSRPLFVLRHAIHMLTAIELNDQLRISTNKVGDEAIDRNLPFEFPACESAPAQTKPKNSLCIRLMPTQASCSCRVVGHLRTNYLPNPLTPPLSPAGRGGRPCSWHCSCPTAWLGLSPNR